MKNRYAVLLTILVIALPIAAVVLSNYSLLFNKLDLKLVDRPEMKIIYLENRGSYAEAPTFIVELYQAMDKIKVSCEEMFGVYFDSMLVPEEKRRARYACAVKELPGNIAELPEKYKTGTIPAHQYVFASRDQHGMAVNVVYAQRMNAFALQNGLIGSGFILEMYTPTRLKRGHAEVLMAVQKPEIEAPPL